MKRSTEEKYAIARKNLLLVLILTVVNIGMVFLDSDTMFLFSATIPYVTAALGFWYQWYLGYVIAAVVLVLYVVCWYFSKKKPGWMIAAAVLFSFDTFAMLWLYEFSIDSSVIIDVLVHFWVMYYLIMGIANGYKSKDEKEERERETAWMETHGYEAKQEISDTPPLRLAGNDKHRLFLETTVHEMNIVFRRVKRINELVVDGYVYAEYEALAERPHTLCAVLNGHVIEAGMDAKNIVYIIVDGEMIEKKFRLI